MRVLIMAGLLLATPVLAQEAEPAGPVIVAYGQGEAQRPADIYLVSGEIVGEGATQVEALGALATLQSHIEEQINAMDVEAIEVRTGALGVAEVYPQGCDDNGRARGPNLVCEITGHTASLSMIVRVRPAERAGDVVSLMSELGARSASLNSARLSTRDDLQREAGRLAFEAARAEAEVMAAAAGGRLGRVLRVQDARAPYGRQPTDTIVVTGSRVTREGLVTSAPTVSLSIAPPEITETVTVSVIFEPLP